MAYAESIATSVSGGGLSRHGTGRWRQGDFRRGCGREGVSFQARTGLREPRVASSRLGADEESPSLRVKLRRASFSFTARDTGTESCDGNEVFTRHFLSSLRSYQAKCSCLLRHSGRIGSIAAVLCQGWNARRSRRGHVFALAPLTP